MSRTYETHILVWNGITIEITWCPNWSEAFEAAYGYPLGHLEIRSIDPEAAPLPFTKTGFRSHFCTPNDVQDYGGPVSFVRAWLDEAAKDPEWKEQQKEARQGLLF